MRNGAGPAIVDAGPLYAAVDADDSNHEIALEVLGDADASVVALAERLGTDRVITFDRRHFRAVRPSHCERFRLMPDDE